MARPVVALCVLALCVAAAHAAVWNADCSGAQASADAICKGNPDGNYCYPCKSTKFVRCAGGKATMKTCSSGYLFDYPSASCVAKRHAQPCQKLYCPAPGTFGPGTNGVSNFDGQFGVPGNATYKFDKTGKYSIFCPFTGHCMMGMHLSVDVAKVPSPKYKPTTIVIPDFTELTMNADLYPKTMEDLLLYVGDSVTVVWDEPVHVVAVLDQSAAGPINPFPPRPKYACPDWKYDFKLNQVVPNPGDIEIAPAGPFGNATWTANATGTYMFACPIGNHCRMGMVFKVTVTAKLDPRQSSKNWPVEFASVAMENSPDLTVSVGDTIQFWWTTPMITLPSGAMVMDVTHAQFHGVYLVPSISAI